MVANGPRASAIPVVTVAQSAETMATGLAPGGLALRRDERGLPLAAKDFDGDSGSIG